MRLSKWSRLALTQIAILVLPITGLILSDNLLGYAANIFALLLGLASLCFIAYSRRRSLPDEAKTYIWVWKRPEHYTGTRAMWFAELLSMNLLGFVHRRAVNKDLRWDMARIAHMSNAAAEVTLAQRQERALLGAVKRMTEGGALDKMGEAFAGMGEALAGIADAMKDGFGQGRMQEAAMAEQENEAKMRFQTMLRTERLNGHNAVVRMARDARRELGLPLR